MRHGVLSGWQQGALPGSNTAPPPCSWRSGSFSWRNPTTSSPSTPAWPSTPPRTEHCISSCASSLSHQRSSTSCCSPTLQIDCTSPPHTGSSSRSTPQQGVRQGNSESPLLCALLLEPLLRAQGIAYARIRAYINHLHVVAHTLQDFIEGLQVVAVYLGMMGMERNPCKCAMATTEGVPTCTCTSALIWQPPGSGYRRRTPSSTWGSSCSRTRSSPCSTSSDYTWRLLAPPKVIQDVILALLAGRDTVRRPFIADDSNTARYLDHVTTEVAKDFDASRDSLKDDRALGLTRVLTRCQQAAVALVHALVHQRAASVRAEAAKIIWETAGAHSICPEVQYPVPEFVSLAGRDWVLHIFQALALLV